MCGGRATLDRAVIAQPGGKGDHAVMEGAKLSLRAGIQRVRVVLQGLFDPTRAAGGSIRNGRLDVLWDAVDVLEPATNIVLLQRIEPRVPHEVDPLVERSTGPFLHRPSVRSRSVRRFHAAHHAQRWVTAWWCPR